MTSVSKVVPHLHSLLIIDDTPTNLQVMVEYLEGYDFQVMVAQDGAEGFERAKFLQPDLILLDVIMPGMDGFETCRCLKASESTRDIPVIFMTALTEIGDKVAAFEAGGADYVTKPFQMAEVLARVNAHLALKVMQQQLAAQNLQLQQEAAVRRQAEAALQQTYDELEQRVALRTAELAQANASLNLEIAEHKQTQERISYMAHHDALTGLPNRALVEDRINQAIAAARRSQTLVAVLFVDLDHFKHINDSLGHHIGDRVLQVTARRLQECMRESDSVARLGGDEFLISLTALVGSNDATQVAEKALQALSRPYFVSGHELHVSGSIGISLYPNDGQDAETLMRAADTAMYHAKEKGRSNFQHFTAALNDAAQQRLSLANRLRHALAQDELLLHYQPQWDIESGKIFSAEALLRWRQPDASLISAAEFIDVAEETGLILAIGENVLRQACAHIKQWRNAGHPDLRIAVNLSARQLYQPGFEHLVTAILEQAQLPANALELEITESIFMLPSQDNIATLNRLAEMGVQFSIDDFGMEYSNLAYLQHFPIHALKIDRSFVSCIGQNNRDAGIVIAIIAMANSLHLRIIAEGVESIEQASFLKAHGCLAAQGFYYSAAVSAQTFGDMLDRQAALV